MFEAEIVISYDDEKTADAISKAVAPDNISTSSLTIRTLSKGCQVVSHVKCSMRLQTFLATLEDLLRCIAVTEKALYTTES